MYGGVPVKSENDKGRGYSLKKGVRTESGWVESLGLGSSKRRRVNWVTW